MSHAWSHPDSLAPGSNEIRWQVAAQGWHGGKVWLFLEPVGHWHLFESVSPQHELWQVEPEQGVARTVLVVDGPSMRRRTYYRDSDRPDRPEYPFVVNDRFVALIHQPNQLAIRFHKDSGWKNLEIPNPDISRTRLQYLGDRLFVVNPQAILEIDFDDESVVLRANRRRQQPECRLEEESWPTLPRLGIGVDGRIHAVNGNHDHVLDDSAGSWSLDSTHGRFAYLPPSGHIRASGAIVSSLERPEPFPLLLLASPSHESTPDHGVSKWGVDDYLHLDQRHKAFVFTTRHLRVLQGGLIGGELPKFDHGRQRATGEPEGAILWHYDERWESPVRIPLTFATADTRGNGGNPLVRPYLAGLTAAGLRDGYLPALLETPEGLVIVQGSGFWWIPRTDLELFIERESARLQPAPRRESYPFGAPPGGVQHQTGDPSWFRSAGNYLKALSSTVALSEWLPPAGVIAVGVFLLACLKKRSRPQS